MPVFLTISNQERKKFFNPAIPTKIFSQSSNPDGLYQPIPIIKFFLVHYLNLRETFQWVMIFLTSSDPLKILLTVRRQFISFHQNDDILRFRSFQSFARITHASHGNDFLQLNFDHWKMY